MTPNLYRIMCHQTAAETRRQEFRAACRELCSVLREPSMLLLAGAAAGTVLAAVVVAIH